MLDNVALIRPKPGPTRGFADLGHDAVQALTKAASHPEAVLISRALISGLAVDVEQRLATRRLTPYVAQKNREWQERLYNFLADQALDDYFYPSSEFVKDFRFVHAMSVYFGTQFVDLNEGIGPKTALKMALNRPFMAARTYFQSSLRFHVESRWLDDFDEASWRRFYIHVADLLEVNPDKAGMVSTSWFFDPNLAAVSPRLGYLIGIPLSGGACIIKHRTTQFDIDSATSKSQSRRQLYEAGKYMPVSYSFVWNRRNLITWAKQQRR